MVVGASCCSLSPGRVRKESIAHGSHAYHGTDAANCDMVRHYGFLTRIAQAAQQRFADTRQERVWEHGSESSGGVTG